MKLNNILILCSVFLLLVSCGSSKSITTNYKYKTECIRIEFDGSHSLAVWGNGNNKSDAVENGKKKAISDILFNGINDGKRDCYAIPLILEINAQKNYEDYFNKFFGNNGEYKNFISVKKELKSLNSSADKSLTYKLEVNVLRAELKQKMISDRIIKNEK
ncbi:hypothetical protein [Flavobacterium sp.]